jgi:hypothetical protein
MSKKAVEHSAHEPHNAWTVNSWNPEWQEMGTF